MLLYYQHPRLVIQPPADGTYRRQRLDLWTLGVFDFLWALAQRRDVDTDLYCSDLALWRCVLWDIANRPVDIVGIAPGWNDSGNSDGIYVAPYKKSVKNGCSFFVGRCSKENR